MWLAEQFLLLTSQVIDRHRLVLHNGSIQRCDDAGDVPTPFSCCQMTHTDLKPENILLAANKPPRHATFPREAEWQDLVQRQKNGMV